MSINDDELSPYAPIRQRREPWWTYARHVGKYGHVAANGMISAELPQMIQNNLVALYLSQFHTYNKSEPNASYLAGLHLAKVEMFHHLVPIAAQYELCGRQIFDLEDNLVEMLKETGLGECTLEGINLPYDAFYVRFGKQDGVKVYFEDDEFEYLDGAFVARTPYDNETYRLKFGFTTVKADGRGVMLPGYFIDILPNEQKLLVSDAVEAALARRLAECEDNENDSEQERAMNSHRRVEINEGIAILRDGASLLVNALFYLESIRDQQTSQQPGRDTPPERVAKWFQVTPEKRHKQQSSLTADGYAVVRLVGQEASSNRNENGGALRVHWRRGHWRYQRHGEDLSLKKRIWIKPVMVGAEHHDGTDLTGHIYVANGSGASLTH
jgi:hypothetical protein